MNSLYVLTKSDNSPLNNIFAWTLCLSTCIAFIALAVANVLSAFALLFFLLLCWQAKKSGALGIENSYRRYVIAVLMFLVCLLPGELASHDIYLSMGKYFSHHILRWLPFFGVTMFLNKRTDLAKKFLLIFIIATSLECIGATLWVLLGIADRSHFGAGMLDLPAEICFLTPVVCVSFFDDRISLKYKKFLPLVLPFFVAGLIACASRGGWIVFIIVMVLSTVPYMRKYWKLLFATIFSLLLIMTLIYKTTDNADLRHRINSLFKLSSTEYTDLYKGNDPFGSFHLRIAAWISGVKIWQDNPVFGIGSAQWPRYYHSGKYQMCYVEIPQSAVDREIRKRQLEASLAKEIKKTGNKNSAGVKKIKAELQRNAKPLSLSGRRDRPAWNIPNYIKLSDIRERFLYLPADFMPHTHNNYLQVLVEHGIIGLIGFLFLCICFLKYGLTQWLVTRNPFIWMFTCSWCSFLLVGTYDFFLNFYAYTRTVSMVTALLLVLAATDLGKQE